MSYRAGFCRVAASFNKTINPLMFTKPLQDACDEGAAKIANLLLLFGARTDELDKKQRNILQRACMKGDLDVVKVLLRHGMNPTTDKSVDQRSALHEAIFKGHTKIAYYLMNNIEKSYRIETQSAIDTQDFDGNTPLFYSVYLENGDMTEELLRLGADPNRSNKKGITPLYKAVNLGNTAAIKALLGDDQTDIYKGLYNAFTPLMVAALTGRKKVVEMLLNEMDDTDKIALKCDQATAEQFALDNNINIPTQHSDYFNKSAAEMAFADGFTEIGALINEKLE